MKPNQPFQIPQYIQEMLDERKRTMADFTEDHRPLVIYAIYREDIFMTPPKMAAMCGHAFTDSHDIAKVERPEITSLYRGTGHGTKKIKTAKNLRQLLRAYEDAKAAGLPCVLVMDRGHVFPPDFDGNPIIVAVGIGPVYRDEAEKITKRYTDA